MNADGTFDFTGPPQPVATPTAVDKVLATPVAKIVRDPALLPDYSGWRRFVMDCETTSFKDDEMALNSYAGHRIAGVAISLADDTAWYVPVRHRGVGEVNCPLEPFRTWLRGLMARTDVEWCNHNIKFDWRFVRAEGVDVKCRIADTMVLARLVQNVLPKLTLEFVGQWLGLGGKSGDDVKAYLKSVGSKDFGVVPVRMMAKYAVRDARLTYAVRRALEKRLPEHSKALWQLEKEFTVVLAEMEEEGVRVDVERLRKEWHASLTQCQKIQDEIDDVAGWEVEANSSRHITELLVDQLKIKPTAFTENGAPSWTKAVLENLVIPPAAGEKAQRIGQLLRGWSYLQHYMGQYVEGWLRRADDDGIMHPDFKQAGTVTGRLSASDPNAQNIPVEAERMIVPRPGDVLIIFDYSQVEYRVFAHYTRDPNIMGPYLTDPDADFHQSLADMLGVPRQYAKTTNFSLIYGMGKEKLLNTLMAIMSITKDQENRAEMEKQLRDMVFVSGLAAADNALQYIKEEAGMRALAEKIYDDYHQKFPSIRAFSKRVGRAAQQRCYVRNLFGRHYDFDMSHHDTVGQKRAFGAYRAVNYLIQGSCSDLLRKGMVRLRPIAKQYDGRPFMSVHDSIYVTIPRANAPAFFLAMQGVLEDCPEISVPIRVEGKVATRNAAADVAIKTTKGKARGASIKEKNDAVTTTWYTGGGAITEVDVVEALAVADAAAEHSKSPVELSLKYRVGRHGV